MINETEGATISDVLQNIVFGIVTCEENAAFDIIVIVNEILIDILVSPCTGHSTLQLSML